MLKDGTAIELLHSDILIPYKRYNNQGTPFLDENYGGPAYVGKEAIGADNHFVGGSNYAHVPAFKVISGITVGRSGTVVMDNVDYQNTVVRCTFLATPSNGGKKYTIVKTFKATVVDYGIL